MNKKWLIGLAFIAFATFTTACGNDQSEDEPVQDAHGDMPQPNLEDIPDVVAEVNGIEISRDDFAASYQMNFQEMTIQSQMTGQEVDEDEIKNVTIEFLVDQELLEQRAESSSHEVSEQDVNETLENIAAYNGLESTEQLLAALEEQGMSEEEILSQVELQVKLESLIAEEAGSLEPTEEEIVAAYEQAVAQQEQMDEDMEMPPLDDVRSDIEQQLIAQKESEVIQQMVNDMREEADITIHL